MTNPAQAMKVLITYAICIPLAMLTGYLLTEVGSRPDYSTLGFLAFVMALLVSPIFIRWHYPIMIFGLSCPMYLFFLPGNPPLSQVAVLLSFGIAIIERTLNSERRFISAASMVWPMLFIAAIVYMTAKLTGGIGLHSFGGDVGGGKKYIAVFCGVATYFAITSRPIPLHQRSLYIVLFFLASVPGFVSDLFPYLPSPLNYVNYLFPPSSLSETSSRLGACGTTAGAFATYMMARYGLRGIFMSNKPHRAILLLTLMALVMLGGFRGAAIAYGVTFAILFVMEGLHRTRLLLVVVLGMIVVAGLMVPFANKLPVNFQRALSFLPLHFDAEIKADAEGSSEWRLSMWRDLWPKVPQYLLLGKGYALTAEDYSMMGDNVFSGATAGMDRSTDSLAISGDYHNGPLSVLMPFGIWGAIGFMWLTLAGLRIVYRNYQYGDPEIKTVNRYILLGYVTYYFTFFFIFGSFSNDVGFFAKWAGFSIALNAGVCGPKTQAVTPPRIKPLPRPQPLPA
jgi:hypothetical protein